MNAQRELLAEAPIAIARKRRSVTVERDTVEVTVAAFEQERALRVI